MDLLKAPIAVVLLCAAVGCASPQPAPAPEPAPAPAPEGGAKPPIVVANAPVADDGVAVRNTGALADQAAQN